MRREPDAQRVGLSAFAAVLIVTGVKIEQRALPRLLVSTIVRMIGEPFLLCGGQCPTSGRISCQPALRRRALACRSLGRHSYRRANDQPQAPQAADKRPDGVTVAYVILRWRSARSRLDGLSGGQSPKKRREKLMECSAHYPALRSERQDGHPAAIQSRIPVIGSPVSARQRRKPPIDKGRGIVPSSARRLTVRVEQVIRSATAPTSSSAAVSVAVIPSPRRSSRGETESVMSGPHERCDGSLSAVTPVTHCPSLPLRGHWGTRRVRPVLVAYYLRRQ